MPVSGFDLRNDPLEFHDLFDEPDSQNLIAGHRRALSDWLMFETPPPIFLDEAAPQIQSVDLIARAEMNAYFEEQHALRNSHKKAQKAQKLGFSNLTSARHLRLLIFL